MAIRSIRILNYRNYTETAAGPFARSNIVAGRNGSGKTNFLESIYLMSELESFRGVALSDLIRWKQDTFYVAGDWDGDRVEVGFSADKRAVKWNGRPAVQKDLKRKNPVVVFLPEDVRIVTGDPDEKRDFIDSGISHLDADYRESLLRYQKALKQRNAHLKFSQKDASVWDRELVKYGSRVIGKRLKFIQGANVRIGEIYFSCYGVKPEIKYFNTFKIEDSIEKSFAESLRESGPAERQKKYTVVGPHRDNYEVLIPQAEKRTARSYASQGQRRTMAIAFNIHLSELLEKELGRAPVLLIDDVLLELDRERRAKVLELFLSRGQAFFTATDPSLFRDIIGKSALFEVKDGMILPRTVQQKKG